MSIYIDADAFVRWERGSFDLPAWMEKHPDEAMAFPATVWQQLVFGIFAWPEDRAAKRSRSLLLLGAMPVIPFSRAHAVRAAALASELKLAQIGFADFQIAATAVVDGAELLTFNTNHFKRVPGLVLADTTV
jgi:predicted nucleic acid-binding protein